MFGTLFLSIAMVPYLAMYYGYIGFNLLYHITTLGVSKNWHTLGSMLVVACICSVFDIAVTAGLPTASDMLFVFLFDALSFVIYNTILYLLCREIFEGRGKNVEVKQAEPQLKHATAA
jgi:membrane protein implicated in regulation of membrane protease activity